MCSREREREREREDEEEIEGRQTERRAVLWSNNHCFARDSHCVARAVLRSYLLRSPVRFRFSLRSTKTRERSKRSRLTSPSDRSSRTSPSHRPISVWHWLAQTLDIVLFLSLAHRHLKNNDQTVAEGHDMMMGFSPLLPT